MMNVPLVSVCVQTFQHKDFIGKCLDSILRQKTDFPFEIIVGEDDSTDGTREICTEYAQAHPSLIRLFLRSEKDKVYLFGSKTGRFNFISNLRAARGKYVALIDGDDYIVDDYKLQKQVGMLEQNNELSVCFHQVYIEDMRKASQRNRKTELHVSQYPSLPTYPTVFTLQDEVRENLIAMSSCMFRRSCIDPVPDWFWQVPMIDYPLHLHNAKQGKIGYLPDPMTVYVVHNESMWSTKGKLFQHIKLWHLFTVLTRNHTGHLAATFEQKRLKIGIELVSYYRQHLWEDKDWFERVLSDNEFPQDSELLVALKKPIGFSAYVHSCFISVKDNMRKVISR
jgi:glycosyltransferase involved in cell wall biosynthesis